MVAATPWWWRQKCEDEAMITPKNVITLILIFLYNQKFGEKEKNMKGSINLRGCGVILVPGTILKTFVNFRDLRFGALLD